MKDIRHSKFSRNVALVFSGTLVAQAITFLCSPILTRLYGPEAFGVSGTLIAIAAILAPIVTFAYPVSMTLPEQSSEAKRIAVVSLLIATLFSLVSFIFIALFKTSVAKATGMHTSPNYLLLVPFMIFFLACLEISHQWTLRKHHFSLISKMAVRHAVITNLFKVSAGFVYPSGLTLIVLSILSNAQQAIAYTLKQMGVQQLLREIRSQFQPDLLYQTAIKYKDFPLYRMPQIFVLAISQNFPLLILASFAGIAQAGQYGLARTVMVVPVMLLGNAVGSVFYPRIHQAVVKKENTAYFLKKATLTLAIISLPPFILFFFFSPWLFSMAFGPQWKLAGIYAGWLSLFFYFSIMSKPAIAAVAPLKLQKSMFHYELVSTSLKLAGFLAGLFLWVNDEKAIMLFSLIGAASYLYITLWIIHKSQKLHLPLPITQHENDESHS